MRTTIVRTKLSALEVCKLSRQRFPEDVSELREFQHTIWLGTSFDASGMTFGFTMGSPGWRSTRCDNATWYGYDCDKVTSVHWKNRTTNESFIAFVSNHHPDTNSVWEVIYFGSPDGEFEFLDHLIAANGGVDGLEVLSVRNRQVARRLSGKTATPLYKEGARTVDMVRETDAHPRRERYFEA